MAESKELDEKALTLHKDFLAGRVTASAQLAELLLPEIYNALARKFSNVYDEHLIRIATDEAILYYLRSPGKFDPTRGSLLNFVWQRARDGLLNLLHQRKINHEKFVELIEARTVYSNETSRSETIEQFLITDEQDRQTYKQLRELFPDPVDRALLKLMLDGEYKTAVFADALGILGAPLDEQRAIVKKHKDRIKKVVQRHYERQK